MGFPGSQMQERLAWKPGKLADGHRVLSIRNARRPLLSVLCNTVMNILTICGLRDPLDVDRGQGQLSLRALRHYVCLEHLAKPNSPDRGVTRREV